MKLIPFGVCLLSLVNVCAQTKKINLSSTVSHVTVFTEGAQVERTATASIPAGTSILVFPNISPELEQQSIQVQGAGAFTILSVSRAKNYLRTQSPDEALRQVRAEQAAVMEKLNREANRMKVLTQEEAMLSKNQEVGGINTGVRTQDLREAMDFQRARLAEILEQQLLVRQRQSALESQRGKLEDQEAALMAPRDSSTSDLLITVSSKTPVSGALTLRYMVRKAGWYPAYTFRVAGIDKPLQLEYKASVHQQCGEDWKNVRLSLSSGNPSENGQKPELQPWQMRIFNSRSELLNWQQKPSGRIRSVTGVVTEASGQPLAGASVQVDERSSIGTITNEKGEFSLQLPDNANALKVSMIGFVPQTLTVNNAFMRISLAQSEARLDEVVVVGYGVQRKTSVTGSVSTALQGKVRGIKIQESIPLEVVSTYKPTTVSFDIQDPYSIPSDGKPYTVTIREQEVPVYYEYRAAPKLDPAAYLLAGITDWETLDLLDGEAAVYFEGTYLGKTLLDLQHASDTLFVSLGKDKQISIQRQLQKDYTRSQFIGGMQTVNRHWEIVVKNNKRSPVRIVVEDQLPISTQKEIEVSRTSYGGGRLDEETQRVVWDLSVPSRQEQKVQLQYAVKFPRGRLVNIE
ncbi:mucoidy inhibitor MuiA family protein [Chitinophaga lutea]